MNRTIKIGGLFIVIIVLGVALWGYSTFSTYAPQEYVVTTPTGSSIINKATGEVTQQVKKYSMVDISSHNNATSCYVAINDSVYDLTAWVNLHPGGTSKILSICGTDGTEKFMNKHKGAQKYMDILPRFKIGIRS